MKTTYYLRTLGASNIEKATVQVKKAIRGAVGEGGVFKALEAEPAVVEPNPNETDGTNGAGSSSPLETSALNLEPAAGAGLPDVTPSPFGMGGAATPSPGLRSPGEGGSPESPVAVPRGAHTAAEKRACSIEAIRNGGECEACQ